MYNFRNPIRFSRTPKQEEEGNYSSHANEDVQESERHNLYVQLIPTDFLLCRTLDYNGLQVPASQLKR